MNVDLRIERIRAELLIEAKLSVIMGVMGIDAVLGLIEGFTRDELQKMLKDIKDAVNDIEPTIDFKVAVPVITAGYARDERLLDPRYGYGSIGLGVAGSIGAGGGIARAARWLKGWTGINISFLTEPLAQFKYIIPYPPGRGSPLPPEGWRGTDDAGNRPGTNRPTVPQDVCAKGAAQFYEDANVRITCYQEQEECPANQDGEITNYFRRTEYKTNNVERHITFSTEFDEGVLEWFRPLILRYIDGVDVYLIEQTVPTGEGGACVSTPMLQPVGTMERRASDYWAWRWNGVPDGSYRLVTMSRPDLESFAQTLVINPGIRPYMRTINTALYLLGDLRFHLGSSDNQGKLTMRSDTFTVGSGPCYAPEPELVDTDNQCVKRLPQDFRPARRPEPRRYGSNDAQPRCLDCPQRRFSGGGGGGAPTPRETEMLMSLPIAKSWGDPHVTTFDGSSFSSLHLGEFVYATDGDPFNGFELQVRQARLAGFPDWASFNTAAAVRVGTNTIEVRLPPAGSPDNRLQMFINRAAADLAPGYYTLGDALFQVERSGTVTVWVRDPDLTNPEQYVGGGLTGVRIGLLSEALIGSTERAISLDVSMFTPSTGRYRGMLGTADGIRGNDIRDREGKTVPTLNAFVEAWRVTNAQDSLFTYAEGESLATYNLVQNATFPSREELAGGAGRDYYAEARNLLQTTCRANVDAISPRFIDGLAIEIAAGRSAQNLVASGLCFDEHVAGAGEPAYSLVGLAFEGQVTLAADPTIVIPGARVVVRAVELGNRVLCDTTTLVNGSYACGLTDYPDDYLALERLTLRYRVTGRGDPVTFDVERPAPRAGRWLETRQDITVSPRNVLHLTGQLFSPDGQPLPYGYVRVAGPGFVDGQADANGFYSFYMPLPDGIMSGELIYEAADTRLTTYVRLVKPFDLFSDGIHELRHNITTTPRPAPSDLDPTRPPGDDHPQQARRLLFTGTVRNQHIVDRDPTAPAGVAGTRVVIQADGIEGGTCTTTTSSTGVYTCNTLVTSTDPFRAQVRVEAVGSASSTVAITADDIPAPGSVVVKTTDLTVAPTTFELLGQVTDPGDTPIANATITIRGPQTGDGFFTQVSGKTASNGQYRLFLAVPDTTTLDDPTRVSGSLTYRAEYSTPAGQSLAVQTLELGDLTGGAPLVGQLTTIAHSLSFTGRTIAFTGRVRNSLVEGFWVPEAQVTISSPQAGLLCETTADKQGFYNCDAFLAGNDPIQVDYQVGGRGNATDTAVLDPTAASVGGRLPFAHTLYASPTTLHLTGIVRNTDGTPVVGATVGAAVSGDGRTTTTDDDGRYTLYLVLPNGITTATDGLFYNVTYRSLTGSASHTETSSFTVAAGARTLIERDITVDLGRAGADQSTTARMQISGQVRNSNAGGAGLPGARVEVYGADAYADVGLICAATVNNQGRYSCNGLVEQAPTTMPLRFVVSYQGTEIAALPYSFSLIPGTAFLNEINRDLTVSVTTVLVHGKITDLSGRPLGGASFRVTQPLNLTVTTDAQGDYEAYVPLTPGVTSGSIGYRASYRDIASTGNQAFGGLTDGTLHTLPPLTIRLPFTARSVVLHGTITNTVAAEARQGMSVVLTSPERGPICTTSTDATGTYRCQLFVDDATPFTVAYRVAGTERDSNGQPYLLRLGEGDHLLPPAGGERFYVKDITASPTTLRVTGTITTADSTPAAGAGVRVVGLAAAPASTNSSGQYTLYAVLPETAPLASATERTFLATSQNQSGIAVATVTLVPATRNTRTQDVTLSAPDPGDPDDPGDPGHPGDPARTVFVVGRVRSHQLSEPLAVPGAQVVVSSAALATPCTTTTGTDGSYTCRLTVTSNEPLARDIQVSKRGSATYSTVLTDLPAAGGTTTVAHDFRVTPTLLHLSGTVSDVNQVPLAHATVTVGGLTSASTTTSTSGRSNLYRFVDNTVSAGTLNESASYGNETFDLSRAVNLPVGAVNIIDQPLAIAGRTLRFNGQVVTAADTGVTVPNATVQVVAPNLGIRCTATSQSNGQYNGRARVVVSAPFPIFYVVSGIWGTAEIEGFVSYLPPIGSSTDYPRTLAIPYTPVTAISGQVTDAYGLNLALGTMTVALSTPDLGVFWSTTTTPGGTYTCPPTSLPVGTVIVEATRTGDWGTRSDTSTLDVTMPPMGQAGSITANLSARPTTLLVEGTVSDGTSPLAGVSVPLSSTLNDTMLTQQTGTFGTYRFVLLPGDALSGDVTVMATLNGISDEQSTAVTLNPADLTTITLDRLINERYVRFRGRVDNAHLSRALSSPGTTVTISADGAELCQLTVTSSSTYLCDPVRLPIIAVAVEYVVSGAWGSATLSNTVPPNVAGGTSFFDANLAVSPTLLHVRGSVRDIAGDPLPGMQVTLTSSGDTNLTRYDNGTTTTATDGIFDLYALVDAGVTQGAVTIALSQGNFSATYSELPFTDLTAGAANVLSYTFGEERDLVLRFTGDLAPLWPVPDLPLTDDWLRTTSALTITADAEVLCTQSLPGTSLAYTCTSDPLRLITLDAIDLDRITYATGGMWGQASGLTGTMPGLDSATLLPGGAADGCSATSCTFVRNYRLDIANTLEIAPTILQISGTVWDEDGQPVIDGAITGLTGDGFYTYGFSPPITLDSTASYLLYLIIPGTITEGDLIYTVNSGTGWNQVYSHAFADIVPYTLNTLTHDLGDPLATTPMSFTISTVASGTVSDVTVASDGTVYFVGGNTLRRITPEGVVSTITLSPSVANMTGIDVDASGTYAYLGAWWDSPVAQVRRADLATGAVTIQTTSVNLPTRVAVDRTRNILYISEMNGRQVTMVNLDTGTRSVYADTMNTRLSAVAVGPDGSVYVMGMDAPRLRVYKGSPGDTITTPLTEATMQVVAGNGQNCSSATAACGDGGLATAASFGFSHAHGLAVGLDGSIYIADDARHRIRRVHPVSGIIETIAGTGVAGNTGDGNAATSAHLNRPEGLFITPNNVLYIADRANGRVRKLTPLP